MQRRIIVSILLLILVTACTPATAPEAYSPYVFVTIPANASPTPTPFQPPAAHMAAQASAAPVLLPAPAATLTPIPTATIAPSPTATFPPQVLNMPEAVTFLLLGSDLRPGSSYRTDTLMIAIVRPRDGQVALISIPRDLWVDIPGMGMQRINTAYQSGEISAYPGGGPGLLKDTLLNNLGIEIDHTAMVDFDGFRRIVDTLGGIDVPIACPYTDWRLLAPGLDPENEYNWALYTAGPGLIHMDGDLALWYARSRKKSNDFDRGRRQQEVVRSIFKQALSTQTIAQIPQLYTDFSDTIRTDLDLAGTLELAPLAFNMSNADIRSYYIAGEMVNSWVTPGGAYVLLPNIEAIQSMLAEAYSPSALQQERQVLKIQIQNGSAYDGYDALAAERLNYAGYESSLYPADHRQHAVTLLYDLSADQDAGRVNSLLAILGLPASSLVSIPSETSEFQYVLIVGNDYQPCFIPSELTP
jgi:LCP family protein required for cell wall assembly